MKSELTPRKKFSWYRLRLMLISLLFVYPYMIGFTIEPDSSSGTNSLVIDILIGTGKFSEIRKDCSGSTTRHTEYSVVDYGAALSYHTGDLLKFGAKGGAYQLNLSKEVVNDYYGEPDNSTKYSMLPYINPFIGIEGKYVELTFGAVFLSDGGTGHPINGGLISPGNTQITWQLRFGNIEKVHFSSYYLSSVPIISGSGIAGAGIGFGSTISRNLSWIGASAYPKSLTFTFRQNLEIAETLDLLFRVSAGKNGRDFVGGLSAGVRITL